MTLFKNNAGILGLRVLFFIIGLCATIWLLNKVGSATKQIEVRYYAEELPIHLPTYIYFLTEPGTSRVPYKAKDTVNAAPPYFYISAPGANTKQFLIIKELSRK